MTKGPAKRMTKTLDAENVMLLRHLLDMEISRIRKDTGVDLALFCGVDGRVFSSDIPKDLNPAQFRMLNLSKKNLPHICSQLANQSMEFSIQKYSHGGMVVSGVGDNAFLSLVIAGDKGLEYYQKMIPRVMAGSAVLRHIFELKPINEAHIKAYPQEVQDELKALSRRLFVERFEDTREYKKNMETLAFIKRKVGEILGVGVVDEVVSLVFNELGTSAPYMNAQLWMTFADKVVKDHVRVRLGDIAAEEMKKTWLPELERKLKSFV